MSYRKSQFPYFSLRIDETLALKLKHLSSIHGRSLNKEIEHILLLYISSWDENNSSANEDDLYYEPTNSSFRTALRIAPEILDSLKYIAEYNGRSANKEIEQLLIRHVHEWEEKQRPISSNS